MSLVMKIEPFATERFFAEYEFTVPHLLCASDCESMTVAELLELAGVGPDALGNVWLGYTESQGAPSLREQIAGLYRQVGPEHVITLAAPEEGIFIAMHALLEKGDEVVVLSPCYDSLGNVARHIGCEVIRWPLVEAEDPPAGPGGWRLDLEALARLLSPRTKLVVVNFPHNPTGALPSEGVWQGLVELLERSGTWLFSDEMYRGLEYDPAQRLTSGCDLSERTITLAGLSKTYGLPGLRNGWLVVRDREMRERILGWKDYTTICAPAPSEYLAEIALQVADSLAERSRHLVLENLSLADPFFERWQDLFRWNRPRAGSVALVGVRGISATEFSQRLVTGPGVLLLPGTALGADDHHLRFGFGRRSFPTALDRLDQYLHKGPSSS
jgi:aspartate/methionine/tyrosine aminotransferase